MPRYRAPRTVGLPMEDWPPLIRQAWKEALEPGGVQDAHRHNAVALTLCLGGSGVYSMIEGERVDWHRHAVMVTPPAELHAHHNEGDDMMLSLVAQDGGLFYNARAVGFSFD